MFFLHNYAQLRGHYHSLYHSCKLQYHAISVLYCTVYVLIRVKGSIVVEELQFLDVNEKILEAWIYKLYQV